MLFRSSQNYAQLMGGKITVTSTQGKGSVFHLEVPVEQCERIEGQVETSKRLVIGINPDAGTFRVLIVDDHAENRDLLYEFLAQNGFEIRMAVNGEEAIAAFEQWKPDFIYMDLRMPVMDGYSVACELQSLMKDGKVIRFPMIALTGDSKSDVLAKASECGFSNVITKPLELEGLKSLLEKA